MLNLQIDMGRIAGLAVLSLLILKHRMSVHLFISSSIFLSNVSQFLVRKSQFLCQIYFQVSYLCVIINGILFLTLFSGCWLLEQRNKINFCTWILYPVTLLNFQQSQQSCVCVYVKSLVLSSYRIMSSVNKDGFISPFPIWVPLVIPSLLRQVALPGLCWTEMARTHPCLARGLRKKSIQSFTIKLTLVPFQYDEEGHFYS